MSHKHKGEHHAKHDHQGHMHRGEHMHMHSPPGKDKMIHDSHHKANAEHGLHDGFSPGEHYQEGKASKGGTPSMESNESRCD